MKTELVKTSALKTDPENARLHSQANLAAIKASLEEFGQQKPIVIGPRGLVVAGNGTLEAARDLGWEKVSVVRTKLRGNKAAAYAIADNRTAEMAAWDDGALARALESLKADGDINELATGFSAEEIEQAISGHTGNGVEEDEAPEPPEDPVTKPGDLWLLGEHRVLCGDSTKAEDVARVMAGEKAALCFTSPPYAQQRDYGEAKELVKDWDGLMRGVFSVLPMSDDGQVLVNLGLIFRNGEWTPYWDEWLGWMGEQGWKRIGWYVWDKLCAMPGDHNGRMGLAHEFVWHLTKTAKLPNKWVETANAGQVVYGHKRLPDGSQEKHTWYGEPVQAYRICDSVWRCGAQKGTENPHPAMMPVALAEIPLRSWDGLAYDPFLGSGTTLIAAEQLNRRCFGLEIEPRYCDVIVTRWETLTGKKAKLEK